MVYYGLPHIMYCHLSVLSYGEFLSNGEIITDGAAMMVRQFRSGDFPVIHLHVGVILFVDVNFVAQDVLLGEISQDNLPGK